MSAIRIVCCVKLVHLVIVSFTIIIIIYTGAISRSSYYPEYNIPHTLFNVTCRGDETNLFDCSYNKKKTIGSYCRHNEDAGVICQSISHL